MTRTHQPQTKGAPSSPRRALAVSALVLIVLLFIAADRLIHSYGRWLLLVVGILSMGRICLALLRFARLPRAAKANYPHALWARIRWRWLTRNLGLAYEDHHKRGQILRNPVGTSVVIDRRGQVGEVRVRFPKARIRADEHGLVATVKTVPKSGRRQFEDQAEHIANAWGCVRVSVSQPKPGRLIVRGLRTDPLTLPFGAGDAPAGVYETASIDAITPLRLYVGRDEWGADRSLPLPGVTGITVGGLPGFGKTSLINSWLMQLAGLPVQFVFIDGKGGGDYTDWADRAWLHIDDELPEAAAAIEDVHALMRQRFGTVLEQTGKRNAWHAGPSPAFPLIVTVIDECHSFFDLDAVKGDQKAEKHVRTCRSLTGQLVKKGRSVLMLTILITQKQTADAIPTAIRDNCRLGLSFAVRTRDAAVAALGEVIREYPSYCPTTLQDPVYVGVATASLRTGQDPFVRIRVPEISEAAAAERARATAHLRRDPAVLGKLLAPLAPVSKPSAVTP